MLAKNPHAKVPANMDLSMGPSLNVSPSIGNGLIYGLADGAKP